MVVCYLLINLASVTCIVFECFIRSERCIRIFCLCLELTADLTKYLQNCAYKLCSKSKSVSELLLLLKPATEEPPSAATDGPSGEQVDGSNDDGGRRLSVSGSAGSEISEVTKWSYCSRLTDWLYHVSWGMWNGNRNGNQDSTLNCFTDSWNMESILTNWPRVCGMGIGMKKLN